MTLAHDPWSTHSSPSARGGHFSSALGEALDLSIAVEDIHQIGPQELLYLQSIAAGILKEETPYLDVLLVLNVR